MATSYSAIQSGSLLVKQWGDAQAEGPDFGTIVVMAMIGSDSIISSNRFAVVTAGVVMEVAVELVGEVGNSVVATKCNMSLVEHHRNEGEGGPENYS